jgi:hypothetical protein
MYSFVTFIMASTKRILSADVAPDSPQVEAMTAELLHVSWADLKSQMVAAEVPGAKDIDSLPTFETRNSHTS